ncbi:MULTISPECIES: hypothetical protein [unclassified Cryobacterium]|uniref:hypothetical protein n=1 Tax=unclassified Cryobacterium TaxID=2649013 RepID=UPI00106D3B40|nr:MULTISPECIES: hypothetical protein [unclassified Cryobacterium]TFC56973.1 hypothetical protein E3O68_03085 [Cryobacterium sp. TMB3-1-2]TFC67930.1 hypothetical protein E3T21_15885 [Cryobacterium sp. TMB3-15]TFC76849.1 hypothetical protein E3T22_07795 [Cryobacterium sp. TMB3-10]TFD42266.1 hypothetical protein E3T58_09380 [Cryobacterium sp. TMB3-12]
MTSARNGIFKRISGFTVVPLLSILSSFMLLPLLARYGGAEGWVSLAIGQSVGGFAAILIVFGWTLIGPKRVAGKAALEATGQYWISLVQRSAVAVVAIPLAVIVSAALSPSGHVELSVGMALAASLAGFSPAWFWVGSGTPRSMVVFEALPRLLATLSAFLVLLLTQDLRWYPILLIFSTLLGYVWFSKRVLTREVLNRFPLRFIFGQFKSNLLPALTVLTSGAYTSITVSLVTAVTPLRGSTEFVSGDKLYRLGTQAIAISGNAFQGWVSEHEDASVAKRRMRSALYLNVALGLAGGTALALIGPWFSGLLFSPELAVGAPVMAFFGLAYFWLSVNSALGRLVLTPLDLNKAVLVSTVAGALVGVPGILYGASQHGALGAAVAVAGAEFVVTTIQLGALGIYRSQRTRVNLPASSSETVA